MDEINPDTWLQSDDDSARCEANWAEPAFLDTALLYFEGYVTSTDIVLAERDIPTLPLMNIKSFENIVGIALNGVFLYTANTHEGYDAFFP